MGGESVADGPGQGPVLVQTALLQKGQLVLNAAKGQQAQSKTGDADTEQEEQRQLPAFQ